MSNPPKPETETPAQPAPTHSPTLPAAIQRFANALVTLGTHPDSGMFLFDAQELTVNEKLDTLKTRALVDCLCAAGLLDRKRFENRLEELVTRSAIQLEEGAKRLAFSARTGMPPGKINGSDG